MTKENILKSFIEDPILIERGYISKDKIKAIKFIDLSNVKLIEVIKIAINGNIDGESEGAIGRKINKYLNK